MARQFLAFLGAGNYKECNYLLGEHKIVNVIYIQEALVRIFCKDWSENDQIRIFVTEESEKKHWSPEKSSLEKSFINQKIGLRKRLFDLHLSCDIQKILVPSGKNEEELWEIFEIIYNTIEDESELILDITHGFRSLPMLMIIVINYAKIFKKISVKGIFYGAYESIEVSNNVKNMSIEEKNAPIFDLLPFEQLLNWSFITHNIIEYGDFSGLKFLTKTSKSYESSKQSTFYAELKEVAGLINDLNNFADLIRTNRGRSILQSHNFNSVKKKASKALKNDRQVQLLDHLIKPIFQKLKAFENKNIENGYKAVEWCIDHKLVQQAYTLLQETMITEILINYFGEELMLDREIRENKVKIAFDSDIRTNIDKFKKEKKSSFTETEINEIIEINKQIPDEYIPIFEQLRIFRNDINHAGMKDNAIDARTIIEKIDKLYNELQECRKKLKKKKRNEN